MFDKIKTILFQFWEILQTMNNCLNTNFFVEEESGVWEPAVNPLLSSCAVFDSTMDSTVEEGEAIDIWLWK
jgi:hypothetical protein